MLKKSAFGSSLSTALPITLGLPQGAVLSPLLFCVYTNDLPTVTQTCDLNSFDQNTFTYIICAVVMGKIYYGSTVWSNTSAANIRKLQAVKNFACGIIANGKKFDHITPILRDIGWLFVKEHLLYRDLVMIYKCMNGLAPRHLCDLFHKRSELNNRVTRNKEALCTYSLTFNHNRTKKFSIQSCRVMEQFRQ